MLNAKAIDIIDFKPELKLQATKLLLILLNSDNFLFIIFIKYILVLSVHAHFFRQIYYK